MFCKFFYQDDIQQIQVPPPPPGFMYISVSALLDVPGLSHIYIVAGMVIFHAHFSPGGRGHLYLKLAIIVVKKKKKKKKNSFIRVVFLGPGDTSFRGKIMKNLEKKECVLVIFTNLGKDMREKLKIKKKQKQKQKQNKTKQKTNKQTNNKTKPNNTNIQKHVIRVYCHTWIIRA